MLAVLPIGAWYGYVAWVSGSIRHSILAHFCGNAIAVIGMTLGEVDGDAEEVVADPSPI